MKKQLVIQFDLPEEWTPEQKQSYEQMTINLLGTLKDPELDQKKWCELSEYEIFDIKKCICWRCKHLSINRTHGLMCRTCDYINNMNQCRFAFPGIGCLKTGKYVMSEKKASLSHKKKALMIKLT